MRLTTVANSVTVVSVRHPFRIQTRSTSPSRRAPARCGGAVAFVGCMGTPSATPMSTGRYSQPYPDHESPLHESPLHDRPLQDRPLQESPSQAALLQDSPLHESPLHESPLHESPLQE